VRIIFMGSPRFAVPSLEALVAAGQTVLGVVTQPDRPRGRSGRPQPTPVKEAALRYGLSVWQPSRVGDPGFVAALKELEPDAVVVVAYGQILPREVLAIPRYGCINVHASLLPKYRGAAPIHRAIMNGETETGVTTMYLDEGMDTGDIIFQATLAIGEEDNVGTVHDRLAALGAGVLLDTLAAVEAGTAPRVAQNHGLATYAPPLTRADERIDWRRPARAIYNHVRGMDPWPGAYTVYDGRIWKVWRVRFEPGSGGRPGEILEATPDQGIRVQAGDGTVVITDLQPAGGRRLSAAEFLRGYRVRVGTVLGDEG